jgi:hypothetical protein
MGTNEKFELRGVNHVALVCSDMAPLNHVAFDVPLERSRTTAGD